MGRLRGLNRKGLIALSLKLEQDAKDGRKEFKKWGYYSGSVLTYQETLLVIDIIKKLEKAEGMIQIHLRGGYE